MAQEHASGSSGQTNRSAALSDEAVRESLARILLSHEFRTSKRSQDFLRYVVEAALGGRGATLKERVIGVEVFGRAPTYDPSEDATVRVKAGEVRRRLAQYYAGQGMQDRVRIELPQGSYVPEFRELNEPAPHRAPGRNWPWRWLGLAAVLMAASGLALWAGLQRRESLLDHFWEPVLKSAAPVSLCASYVPVYTPLHEDALDRGFVLLNDQFVGGGDLIATSRLAAMLARLGRPYRVRVGDEVTFLDLRSAPAVLVGYSYTRWKDISSQQRFFIDINRRPVGITDNGKSTPWNLPNLQADRRTNEDYAIVSRVFQPDTQAMLVEIAGITQYGTDAAADLVTSRELFRHALRGAPEGWEKKNLQLVLHVKVIAGAPSVPRVVAAHYW